VTSNRGPGVALSVIAATMGLILGSLFPRSTAHAVAAYVDVDPGANWGWLTTSWHDSPTSLDWGHELGGSYAVDHAIAWRSWSYRSDSASPVSLGSITAYTANGTCINVSADYYDNSSSYVGTVNYTHAYKTGSSGFTLYADNGWEYQSVQIAAYGDVDDEICEYTYWDAPHLRQNTSWGFNSATSSFNTTGTYYSITSYGVFQAWKYMEW
jgi:hypothetical protein